MARKLTMCRSNTCRQPVGIALLNLKLWTGSELALESVFALRA